MLKYFLFRIIVIIPMVLASIFIVFTLGFLAPGDPITNMYRQTAAENPGVVVSQADIDRAKARWGLDRPFWVQYFDYMNNLLHGNFGRSISGGGAPILPSILKVLPISAQMGVWALLILTVAGISLGTVAALRQNTWIDYIVVGGSILVQTVPVFVTAPLLLLILVRQLKIMDVPYGWEGMFNPQIILPVILLTLGPLAVVVRQTRAGVLEVLGSDYVRTANAKGLPLYAVVIRHVLRTALIPVVTSLGMITTGLVTGSLFIEKIFAIPGFGRLSVAAITDLDYPMILGTTIFAALAVMLSNLIVDFIYPFLDPRVIYD